MQNRRYFLRLGLLCGGYSLTAGRVPAEPAALSPAARLQDYKKAAEKIRHLFEKKKLPQFGDWLGQKKEPGQTFTQYLATNPNTSTEVHTKLYLQPIGDFTAEETAVLRILREYLHLHFGLEVEELRTIGTEKIPSESRRYQPGTFAEQLQTPYILDRLLIPNRPKDAVAVLAITASDLWPGDGWNFVFGVASLKQRVGVWSTSRLGDPVEERARFLRRVLQVAVHETGHMFGIRHCIAYECCMNGSNSLEESDRASMVYCCECDPKLWWSCKLDPAPRAKALADFFRQHSLDREAKEWNNIALALAKP